MNKLRFAYTNHRDEDHEYVMEPHVLTFKDGHWAITGLCIERDGKPRSSNSSGFPIRSFIVAEMREVKEIPA